LQRYLLISMCFVSVCGLVFDAVPPTPPQKAPKADDYPNLSDAVFEKRSLFPPALLVLLRSAHSVLFFLRDMYTETGDFTASFFFVVFDPLWSSPPLSLAPPL